MKMTQMLLPLGLLLLLLPSFFPPFLRWLRLWQQQGWTTLFVTHNVTEAVFLSQRVIVMSRRPATIIDEFTIDFEQPRDAELRGTPAFAETTRRVSAALRGAMS